MSPTIVDLDNREVANELFIGGLAPFWMFDYQLQGLFSVVELSRVRALAEPNLYQDTMRRATEVALVGSIGFFEAFCKHQFAALLTIHPPLLEDFARKRPEATIRLSTLARVPGGIDKTLGFLIAEGHDFGSAKVVNGLFRDLLLVTPFSADEADKLDEILRKRHLIVHHAGVHTLASVRSHAGGPTPTQPFRDVVILEPDEYYSVNEFLLGLGVKLAVATVDGLKRRTSDLADVLTDRRDAVQLLLQGVWDEIG